MTTTLGLILAIGVLSAGGAGMAGPAVLMAATTRLIPPERRGLATGIVNAGGSFGQFVMAPIAAALMVGVGWANALQIMGLLVLLCLPAACVSVPDQNQIRNIEQHGPCDEEHFQKRIGQEGKNR